MIKSIVERFENNPKKIFLIDGLGALLSAFLLGMVLVRLEFIFGIPSSVLYFLAAIPLFFVIYDIYSYQKDRDRVAPYLKGIAIMNSVYCLLSIGLGLYHKEVITFWGWWYIISEVAIISILVFVEIKVSKRLETK